MDSQELFKFKLAGHLKMTVAELEDRMSYPEFIKWQEYYAIEPFEADRVEMMLSQVISALSGQPSFEFMVSTPEETKEAIREKELQKKISETLEGL